MRTKLLFVVLLLVSPAWAITASEICGDGIDDSLQTGGAASGTKGSCPGGYHDAEVGDGCDADCSAPDKDNDGYTSDGTLGSIGTNYTDVDDTKKLIYPGIYVGCNCGTGENSGWKLAQTNGSYGSCTCNASTPLCDSSTNSCFYIDCDSGNDSNSGTYASPWQTLGKASGGSGGTGLPSSPRTLVAGDTIYVWGTCSTTFTASAGSSALFDTVSDGTATDKISLVGYPGKSISLSNTNGYGVIWRGDYGVINGLTIASARTSANNATAVYGNGAQYLEVKNTYISSMSGHGDNNDAGIYVPGTHDTFIHHNFINDVVAATGNADNIAGITWLDDTGGANGANHRGEYNTIWNDSYNGSTNGRSVRTKHGVTGSESGTNKHRIKFNTFINFRGGGIVWSSSGLRAIGNRFTSDPSQYALKISDDSGTRFEDNIFTYNTVIGALGLMWNNPSNYSGTKSLTVSYNNVVGTAASYVSGNNDGILSIAGYETDAQKATLEAIPFLACDNNCWYSPNATAVFSYFGTTTGASDDEGDHYSFASWQGILSNRYDAASSLGSTGHTSPKYEGTGGCATKGWAPSVTSTTTTTTTTSTTTTTHAQFKAGVSFRSTSGYVTDPTDYTYCICSGSAGESYPQTRNTNGTGQSVTFGWTSTYTDQCRDRNTGVTNKQLAGMHSKPNNGSQINFRLDIPYTSSTYKVCLALGDYSNARARLYAQILDNATSRFIVDDTDGTSAAQRWTDAGGTERTDAAWGSSQTCQTGVSFASGILNMKIGTTTSTSDETDVAALYVEEETTTTTLPSVAIRQAQQKKKKKL